jgi:hypothetical protein
MNLQHVLSYIFAWLATIRPFGDIGWLCSRFAALSSKGFRHVGITRKDGRIYLGNWRSPFDSKGLAILVAVLGFYVWAMLVVAPWVSSFLAWYRWESPP